MIAKLDSNQQRQLAIGILAIVVATGLFLTIGPIWTANASRQATLDQAFERLQRYEQIAARDEALLPQYESIRNAQKSSGNHLRSDTVAVAGAELQRRVKTITATNKAQIVSTQILPPADEQGFIRVAIKVRLRGELPAILQSFYDIETNGVYMFVENVSLRDNLAGRQQFKVQVHPMDAEFELVAYMPETS